MSKKKGKTEADEEAFVDDKPAKKKEAKKPTEPEGADKPKKKRFLSKEKLGKEAKTVIEDARYGRSISIDFFRANAWLLVIFIGGMIGMMGLRYKNKTKMAEIKQLEVELTRAKSAKLKEKSEYMSLIRETEIRRLVEEKRLGLEFREDPPIVIEVDAD